MIQLDFVKNKTYYVVGLGKSNRAVVKSLQKSGADIRIWDDFEENLKDFDPVLIRSLDKAPWSKIKAVVVAPGIPPSHPIVQHAQSKDIPVICDVDLYAQSTPQSKIIGVTGTNGKSTTTALIHHILNFDGKAQMGGNIGTPVLSLKKRVDYTVLELSSYQLERTPHLQCDVSVLLNISPDHLAWHGDMDSYVSAKENILKKARVKVISVDDEYCRTVFNKTIGAVPLDVDADKPFDMTVFPRLKGRHNVQNALAAYEVCHALGFDTQTIIDRMQSFEGLPHRQYVVKVINGIPYVNDSKATNAEAASQALNAYKNIFWILGGEPKDGGLDPLKNDLPHVVKAYVFGAASFEFAEFFENHGVPCVRADTLQEVVPMAHKDAQQMRGAPSGTPCVLLSPACASFDQYDNFEKRGDHFSELVSELSDA